MTVRSMVLIVAVIMFVVMASTPSLSELPQDGSNTGGTQTDKEKIWVRTIVQPYNKSWKVDRGDAITFDGKPYVEDGSVMIPMRAIFAWLNAPPIYDPGKLTIAYNGDVAVTRREIVADATGDGFVTTEFWTEHRSISLRLNSDTATVDGKVVKISPPPVSRGGRIFVPLRFVSESLGAVLQWDSPSRTVFVYQGERTGSFQVALEKKQEKSEQAKAVSTNVAGKLFWKAKGEAFESPWFTTVADGWQVRVRTTNVKHGSGKMWIRIFEDREDVQDNGFFIYAATSARDVVLGDKEPIKSRLQVPVGVDRSVAQEAARLLPGAKDSMTRELTAIEMFEHTGLARSGMVETIRGDVTYYGVATYFPSGKYKIRLLFENSSTADISVAVLPRS